MHAKLALQLRSGIAGAGPIEGTILSDFHAYSFTNPIQAVRLGDAALELQLIDHLQFEPLVDRLYDVADNIGDEAAMLRFAFEFQLVSVPWRERYSKLAGTSLYLPASRSTAAARRIVGYVGDKLRNQLVPLLSTKTC